MPCTSCNPPGASREVITSSKISKAPVSFASARSPARNSRSAGMQPVVPCIGSTRIAASSARCGGPVSSTALEIVVAAEQILERRVERAAMAAEIEDAAVVAAVEHQDLRPAGDRAAALTAIRLASVPELVKRTSSIDGKRAQIAAAKRASASRVRAEIEAAVERLLRSPGGSPDANGHRSRR